MEKCLCRSLFEGFCLSFLTQLDSKSHPVVISLIKEYILSGKQKTSPIPQPPKGKYVKVEDYWIIQGDNEPQTSDKVLFFPNKSITVFLRR